MDWIEAESHWLAIEQAENEPITTVLARYKDNPILAAIHKHLDIEIKQNPELSLREFWREHVRRKCEPVADGIIVDNPEHFKQACNTVFLHINNTFATVFISCVLSICIASNILLNVDILKDLPPAFQESVGYAYATQTANHLIFIQDLMLEYAPEIFWQAVFRTSTHDMLLKALVQVKLYSDPELRTFLEEEDVYEALTSGDEVVSANIARLERAAGASEEEIEEAFAMEADKIRGI